MTIQEFKEYNNSNSMPKEWIGQGYGYKLEENWEDIPDDDIIYIPEYAYDGYNVKRCDAYSKEDFRQLARDYDIAENLVDAYAKDVFYTVDWQFPETLMEEDRMYSDEEE